MAEKMRDHPLTIAFQTFGCKVNQYDTQIMREQLLATGLREVDINEAADIYLINTCTVTGTGDKKCLNAIRRCTKRNKEAKIIVAGCLSQREPEEIKKIPGVSVIMGTQYKDQVVQLLYNAIDTGDVITAVNAKIDSKFEDAEVHANEGHTRAVLKIQEGCNRYCSYCIIPYVRGPIRSRTIESIVREAERLGKEGYKEVVLTGIHLTSYGIDFRDGTNLLHVLEALEHVDGVERVRIGSLEPVVVTDNFVEGIGKLRKLCPQFHLALQSGSNEILKLMRRRYTKEEFLTACELLRTVCPQCSITTDVMTGFPGETEALFEETVETCRKAKFARMHVFPYSEREGTAAAGFEGSVPVDIRQNRARRLIEVGQELKERAMLEMLHKTEEVLVETFENDLPVGYTRTYFRCIIENGMSADIMPGHLVQVEILGATEDCLLARHI